MSLPITAIVTLLWTTANFVALVCAVAAGTSGHRITGAPRVFALCGAGSAEYGQRARGVVFVADVAGKCEAFSGGVGGLPVSARLPVCLGEVIQNVARACQVSCLPEPGERLGERGDGQVVLAGVSLVDAASVLNRAQSDRVAGLAGRVGGAVECGAGPVVMARLLITAGKMAAGECLVLEIPARTLEIRGLLAGADGVRDAPLREVEHGLDMAELGEKVEVVSRAGELGRTTEFGRGLGWPGKAVVEVAQVVPRYGLAALVAVADSGIGDASHTV